MCKYFEFLKCMYEEVSKRICKKKFKEPKIVTNLKKSWAVVKKLENVPTWWKGRKVVKKGKNVIWWKNRKIMMVIVDYVEKVEYSKIYIKVKI